MTTHELRLEGCRPEPLGAYLKALGVLRLVGEQADPDARGWWSRDTFILRSRLDEDALIAFFVDDYTPTPIVAPWNGGSGFKAEKNPAAVEVLRAIEHSTSERLEHYRTTIAVARGIYVTTRELQKEQVVARCRNELPDSALRWIDATVVLTGSGAAFPPLLGTGGNDGRFDFSKTFMDRVADVFCVRTGRRAPERDDSRAWIREALSADSPSALLHEAIGQFDPGAAGGANSSPLGAAESLVNPWDWVLLMEGALLFASAAARRFGNGTGRTAVPFTFNATVAGFGTAAEEHTRGEVWVPLWGRPTTLPEISHLIGEGRTDWRGHQARTALDAARAVSTLGVDRGVTAFVRHGLIERNGLATAAVSLGRQRPQQSASVPIAAQLDPWLDRVRRGSNAPASVAAGIRAVERALFEHAVRPSTDSLQAVVIAAASLELDVGRAATFRNKAHVGPVIGLRARDWIGFLDDGSIELDIARSLASQRDRDGASLRSLLRPIGVVEGRLSWLPGAAPTGGLGMRPLADVMSAALARRVVERGRSADRADEDEGVGVSTAYEFGVPAQLDSIAAWLAGEVDEPRLEALLRALLLLDWRSKIELAAHTKSRGAFLSPAFALLAPFFARQPIRVNGSELWLRADPAWPRLLAADRAADVLEGAIRRLSVHHFHARAASTAAIAQSGPRGPEIAAALTCSLPRSTVADMLSRAVRTNDLELAR